MCEVGIDGAIIVGHWVMLITFIVLTQGFSPGALPLTNYQPIKTLSSFVIIKFVQYKASFLTNWIASPWVMLMINRYNRHNKFFLHFI